MRENSVNRRLETYLSDNLRWSICIVNYPIGPPDLFSKIYTAAIVPFIEFNWLVLNNQYLYINFNLQKG